MSSVAIAKTIRSMLSSSAWATTEPTRINAGSCEDFQQELIELAGLDGADVERCTENLPDVTYRNKFLPGHCWVVFDGRHFDAEAPEGVARWEDLPIFVRARANIDKRIGAVS